MGLVGGRKLVLGGASSERQGEHGEAGGSFIGAWPVVKRGMEIIFGHLRSLFLQFPIPVRSSSHRSETLHLAILTPISLPSCRYDAAQSLHKRHSGTPPATPVDSNGLLPPPPLTLCSPPRCGNASGDLLPRASPQPLRRHARPLHSMSLCRTPLRPRVAGGIKASPAVAVMPLGVCGGICVVSPPPPRHLLPPALIFYFARPPPASPSSNLCFFFSLSTLRYPPTPRNRHDSLRDCPPRIFFFF